MGKVDLIKDSIKRIFGMMVMILIFVIGILALHFSTLLVGQQETIKTTGGEELYVTNTQNQSSGPAGSIVMESDEDLRVKQIAPVTPVEEVKGY